MSKPNVTLGELFRDVFAITTAYVLLAVLFAISFAPYIAAILAAVWLWRHL